MPTFCRHNRFLERCPVCSPRTASAASRGAGGAAAGGGSAARGATRPRDAARRAGAPARRDLRVRREARAEDDGYRSALVPGLRSSADAERLADEIAFASGRLVTLETDPPGVYADIRDAADDLEQASWLAFVTAYLSPTDDEDPFGGIRAAATDWHTGELPDLEGVPLGPRTSHDPARGAETLLAYRAWAARAGSQQRAFTGDLGWSAERRFERVFERLALPGLGRTGRFELLVTLGRLGVYELRAGSLQLVGDDATTLAAKRVLGIGDRLNLERRSAQLARATEAPIESLDLALANWAAPQRATMGAAARDGDADALGRARAALGL